MGVELPPKLIWKTCKDLTLSQSSLLAAPRGSYNLLAFWVSPRTCQRKAGRSSSKMYQEKYITRKELDKTLKEQLHYKNLSNTIKAPHFVLYVKDLLIKNYGEKAVEQGGLKVTTSLDLSIQDMAQATVAAEVESLKFSRVTNGASLVTNPATGEILAMVGSRDYFDTANDGNVNVT